jgi:hypothetical protein
LFWDCTQNLRVVNGWTTYRSLLPGGASAHHISSSSMAMFVFFVAVSSLRSVGLGRQIPFENAERSTN